MSLTDTDVQRIAHLARLELTGDETRQMQAQLNAFFGLVEQMQAVDTAGILPLAHPVEQLGALALSLRADEVGPAIDREANQASAPSTQDGLYLVPKVIE